MADPKPEGGKKKGGCCYDNSCTKATCMVLPDGETCGSCAWLSRCAAFFGCKPENTYCDFFPRSFAKVANA